MLKKVGLPAFLFVDNRKRGDHDEK